MSVHALHQPRSYCSTNGGIFRPEPSTRCGNTEQSSSTVQYPDFTQATHFTQEDCFQPVGPLWQTDIQYLRLTVSISSPFLFLSLQYCTVLADDECKCVTCTWGMISLCLSLTSTHNTLSHSHFTFLVLFFSLGLERCPLNVSSPTSQGGPPFWFYRFGGLIDRCTGLLASPIVSDVGVENLVTLVSCSQGGSRVNCNPNPNPEVQTQWRFQLTWLKFTLFFPLFPFSLGNEDSTSENGHYRVICA